MGPFYNNSSKSHNKQYANSEPSVEEDGWEYVEETVWYDEDGNPINESDVIEDDDWEEYTPEESTSNTTNSCVNTNVCVDVPDNDSEEFTEKTTEEEPEIEHVSITAYNNLDIPIDPSLTDEDVCNPCRLTFDKYTASMPGKLESKIAIAQRNKKSFNYDTNQHVCFDKLLESGLIPINIVNSEELLQHYDESYLTKNFGNIDSKTMDKLFSPLKTAPEILKKARSDENLRLKIAKFKVERHNSTCSEAKKIYVKNAFTKDSFRHGNIVFHSSKSIVDYMFKDDRYLEYDFCEVLLSDQSRLFYDIDMGLTQQDMTILEHDLEIIASTINYIRSVQPQNRHIYLAGRVDVKVEKYDQVVAFFQKYFPIETNSFSKEHYAAKFNMKRYNGDNYGLIFVKRKDAFNKNVSAHLHLSGLYFDRSSLVNYKKVLMAFKKKGTYLDPTVYKELQQVFRHSMSGKMIECKAPYKIKHDYRYYDHTVYPQKFDKFMSDSDVRKIIDSLCKQFVISINFDEDRTKVVHNPIRVPASDKKQLDEIQSTFQFDFDQGYVISLLDKQYGNDSERLYGYNMYRKKKLYVISVLYQLGSSVSDIIDILDQHPRIKSDGSREDQTTTHKANERDVMWLVKELQNDDTTKNVNQDILDIIRDKQPNNPLDTYCDRSHKYAVQFSDMICYLQTAVISINQEIIWYDMGENGNLKRRRDTKKGFKDRDQYYITFYSRYSDDPKYYQMHVFDIMTLYYNKFKHYSDIDMITSAPMAYSTYRYPTTPSTEEPVLLDNRVKQLLTNILESEKNQGTAIVEQRFNFIMDCLAYKLQHPEVPFSFGIILTGRQGTGKSTFFSLFESMIGEFANSRLSFDNTQEQFNCDDRHLMLAVYNEVNCANKDRGKIKGLLDDTYRLYNEKFLAKQKEKNLSLKFFVSNQTNLKIAIKGDRRFVTFNSDKPRAPQSFFDSLYEIDKRGVSRFDTKMIENFFTYLLQRKVSSDFSPKIIPRSILDDTIDINTTKDFLELFTTYEPKFNTLDDDELSYIDEPQEEIHYPKLAYKKTSKFNEPMYIIPLKIIEEVARIMRNPHAIKRCYYKDLYTYWTSNELSKYIWNMKNTFERLGEGDGKFQQDLYYDVTQEMCDYFKEFYYMKPGKQPVFVMYSSC